ncbi:LDLR chaperone boca-like isoform X2 [Xenia sp. Carnegie-2017]|uniref:LDLR chaperone boca-like isoform X2 n=1 Tax=Xenia sp. Carnegie-2017 TaxID=2897299 RepID=UPI001F03C6E8|nr:LDLR chaperone boca-like isoform X2 [Xenia sp. Carnegie-2017]
MVDKIAIVVAIIFVINGIAMAKTDAKEKKDKKIGKNINDYTESDIYKLADQWDENDEEYDPDDYDDDDPRKPPPKMKGGFDPSKFNGDPMAMLKLAKKDTWLPTDERYFLLTTAAQLGK